jgi:hypothetical protein
MRPSGLSTEAEVAMIRKLLIALWAVAIVVGPAIAHADYLPEAYGGCAEIKGNNPYYVGQKQRQQRDYKRCLIDTDRFLRKPQNASEGDGRSPDGKPHGRPP